jgi:membrane protease YdiL (CAAX protease family)
MFLDHKAKIFAFFSLSFLISWALWSPFFFSNSISEFWALPGAWGPTISAIVVTYRFEGMKGLRSLLQKVKIWKVSWWTYLVAMVGFLLLDTVALLGSQFFGLAINYSSIWNSMGLERGDWGIAVGLFPIFFLVNTLVGGPIAEELGWRGLAQGELDKRFKPWLSGLIIGLLWSLWHLPLVLFFPQGIGNTPFYFYMPMMMAIGVIFSWFYYQTRGSILLAILLHGGMNFSNFLLGELFQEEVSYLIQTGLAVLVAVGLGLYPKKINEY